LIFEKDYRVKIYATGQKDTSVDFAITSLAVAGDIEKKIDEGLRFKIKDLRFAISDMI
jgi:hypothetical protein